MKSVDSSPDESAAPGKSQRAREPAWVVHPLIVSLLPVLFLYSRNAADITLAQLPGPLLVLLALGAMFWGVGRLMFGSWAKGALLASLTMGMLMFYRHVWEAVSSATQIHLAGYVALPIWVGIYLAAVVCIWRMRRSVLLANRAANVFVTLLLALQLWTLATDRFRWFASEAGVSAGDVALDIDGRTWNVPPADELPDIYYIVLDGYGRADQLDKAFGFDNQDFVSELEARGFFVAQQSTSNYPQTESSLRTSLNMDYYHQPLGNATSFDLEQNTVVRLLKAMGYQYVLVPSGWRITSSSPLADHTPSTGVTLRGELPALLIEWSALWFLFDYNRFARAVSAGVLEDPSGVRAWHDHIERSIELIGEPVDSDRPRFTFAHILCPHPPVVFQRDGSVNLDATITDFSEVNHGNPWSNPALLDQIASLNRLLLKTIDRIQSEATRPTIIILQGDHGTLRQKTEDWENHPSDALLNERMSILLACKCPPQVREQLYDRMTPVNLFRAIFRGQFGADYESLPDRNFWTFSAEPLDVTDRALSSRPDGSATGGDL